MRIASAPYGFAKTSEIPLSRPQALSEAMEQEVQLRESRFERKLESEEKDAAPAPQAAPQRQGQGDALAADYRGAFFRRVQHCLAGCSTTLSLSRGEPSHCAHFTSKPTRISDVDGHYTALGLASEGPRASTAEIKV